MVYNVSDSEAGWNSEQCVPYLALCQSVPHTAHNPTCTTASKAISSFVTFHFYTITRLSQLLVTSSRMRPWCSCVCQKKNPSDSLGPNCYIINHSAALLFLPKHHTTDSLSFQSHCLTLNAETRVLFWKSLQALNFGIDSKPKVCWCFNGFQPNTTGLMTSSLFLLFQRHVYLCWFVRSGQCDTWCNCQSEALRKDEKPIQAGFLKHKLPLSLSFSHSPASSHPIPLLCFTLA